MRIVLAEDQYLLRTGLTRLLTAYGFEVVAAVSTGHELLRAMTQLRPEVSVVDVRLPPTFTDEGLRAALAARSQIPGLPVLVLSQHVETLYARELLADGTGGIGYLLKDRVFSDDEFVDALHRIAGGGTAMDPEVISRLVTGSSRDQPLDRLTPREAEVLTLMAEGRSNAAIATALFLSPSAVTKHIASIFGKLGLTASQEDNRRVLAVLTYLSADAGGSSR
ncbi:response regulator transcription factor (plasmid) [Streptomyces sp. BHT-5-2]|uniref:LuxR C-terminal-related transcriptional regulator n=1 Tax=Streptomyces sp. BHT-5-2 TaxID=2866715 RepID=UPI001C8D36BB|nr:response regulator transcription factor [Streptomyces sp. BHT-5-2]QZL07279.1 response regulator transcription factor [Streptomyces sp. BHT-5-2]